ncbi:MAG: ferrous iron transport protein B [Bacteroidota bacterium]|nr:ferrous iron transport protein B [Bacteroidota bacterium]MDP4216309.1 ferrous iron transport protein B [Bacteroidota bacterium]MDP4244949.1 ferrous iron transport protein B [Bacteroidota bacterium]MDP4255920.1 ferrous iron transport protein B [Bacteroidota bacterium]MDP4258467.1 ferrous iron transport protein B [Bacteroidota bacterium]
MKKDKLHIALVGNPNSGKSSLFNALTGLHQKVGNFPGVTVDKKTGMTELAPGQSANIIDLPGTYSLYPKRADEWVTYKVLLNQDPTVHADIVVLLADASNLKRNLLFCSQIIDLKVPVIVALTMMDLAAQKGIEIDTDGLERELGIPVVPVNPRKNRGIQALKKVIQQVGRQLYQTPARDFIARSPQAAGAVMEVKKLFADKELSDYTAIHYLTNHESFRLSPSIQEKIEQIERAHAFNPTRIQADEILQRYSRIKQIMQHTVSEPDPLQKTLFSERLDDVLLHRRWGYLILLVVLFLLFQSVFWLAQFPMDGIDWTFSHLGASLRGILPDTWWSDLLINGLIAGLSGILVFVPQIMILFGLITILEDTGYMARISFLTDKLMRKVGLNGKSVMPMISGFACAVPAIMSTRNIENKKERLLTILITPLMSCSARLPVYTMLIALVIPRRDVLGIFSLQGLIMMGLYLLGVVMALIVSYVAKWFIRLKEKSFFILELPVYRAPRWNNVVVTMITKAKIFVVDAGKVIIVISLILWALSSFGPGGQRQQVKDQYAREMRLHPEKLSALERQKQSALLATSYAGILGKGLQPVIHPLGYDWKIGIALITSFAAREVFVGTMATLYSVGGGKDADPQTLQERMRSARRDDGSPVYTLASGVSLMIFYVLAMQCMSTLAVVRRETRSWKWPAIQFVYMTGLAYIMSFIAYQLLK